MIQGFSFLTDTYIVVLLAAVVIVFWLAIRATRALNMYIRKNRPPLIDQRYAGW